MKLAVGKFHQHSKKLDNIIINSMVVEFVALEGSPSYVMKRSNQDKKLIEIKSHHCLDHN